MSESQNNRTVIGGRTDPDSGEITRALLRDQSATVLFENINGFKAEGNLFSTREKIAEALNVSPDMIVGHIADAVSSPVKCAEVSDPGFRYSSIDTDLLALPIPRYYPGDGGRYITAGIVVTEYKGKKNVSFHRMMVVDGKRLAVRLVPRHLFTLYNEAKRNGEELNVSICVGACAEVLLSAAMSMDFGADELEVASSMYLKGHGKPLETGRCDNGILVPADCDFVMEARITLSEIKEGPFVDITGTYDFERMQPVIEVDKIWASRDPRFHLILPGGYEHYLMMGLPREPMILRTVRQAVPRVRNVRLTEGGCCWL
ncbi:MAG: UbiD family decarboxylase, partial [Candidatus Methanomethylophilaceae archaeon]|nr:UbiD family decarboxylase [Candidatus Methanomethylophilaceae archaeon]